MAGTQRALQGERWVLFGNRIAARFALLCLVAYVLNAHHVVTCHANTNLYYIYIYLHAHINMFKTNYYIGVTIATWHL